MPILLRTQQWESRESAVSYMVLYTGIDGRGAFDRCEELPEAVAEVERLRNEQSIEDAKIFRLEEVRFEIKQYFRVEIPGSANETPEPATATPVSVLADQMPWSAAAATGSAAAATGSAAAATGSAAAATGSAAAATGSAAAAEVPSMVIAPPPPPPPAPAAPMGFDGGTFASEDEAIVGSRRGLFGR
jgi:hypothetical protein